MISFPNFNLEFNISRIAFSFFGIEIYWYAICIVLGIILAITLCKVSKINYGIEFEKAFECILISLMAGIVGARIYYVIFNLKYYMQNPVKIFAIRDGGLAIYGGLIFGTICIILYCKKNKLNILNFLDYIVPFVAIAQSVGRWGNFFNQEAYGIETNSIFKMGIYTLNGYQEVHPTFLYESIATLVIFTILKFFQKSRKYEGQILLFYLWLYSGIRMFIEGLRIDSLMLLNMRISQILSIAIFVVTSGILLNNKIKDKHIKQTED